MARKKSKTQKDIKMEKIIELKNYLDKQREILFNLYTTSAEKIGNKEDDKVKKMRKVYETLKYLTFKVYPEEYKVEIVWFDNFNGDVMTGKIDINSQMFCFSFMIFHNTITYRIMAALQYFDPNGWCFNEFWKTRVQLQVSTTDIFGFYGDV